jgi:hypothetical protein
MGDGFLQSLKSRSSSGVPGTGSTSKGSKRWVFGLDLGELLWYLVTAIAVWFCPFSLCDSFFELLLMTSVFVVACVAPQDVG